MFVVLRIGAQNRRKKSPYTNPLNPTTTHSCISKPLLPSEGSLRSPPQFSRQLEPGEVSTELRGANEVGVPRVGVVFRWLGGISLGDKVVGLYKSE